MAHITGDSELKALADRTLGAFAKEMDALPGAYPALISALDYYLGPQREVVIAAGTGGIDVGRFTGVANSGFFPRGIVVLHDRRDTGPTIEAVAPWVKELVPIGEATTLYLCENGTCRLPVTGIDDAYRLVSGK